MGTPGFRSIHRRTIITVSSAVVLATVCATTEQRPPVDLRAASYAVDMVAAIEETPTTIGLADSNLMRLGDEDLIDKQLDMMQAMGVQNVRVGISWISTQLPNGDFFWHTTDYVINEANRRGMGVLAVLHETPGWAGDPPLSGQPDPVRFGTWAGKVAEQYKGKISAIEVWNEPNAKFFLNPVDPEKYTRMLQNAYTAIKAVDDPDDPNDDITVIGGVLGSGRTVGDVTMDPQQFLEGMYAAGAHGFFDAFSFHPYKYDMLFSEGEIQPDSPILQLREIRALMEQYGDGDLKVWASEYGLPTTPLVEGDEDAYNSPEKQAQYIKDFLENWQKEEGTGPIFIYSTRDIESGSDSDEDNFGIWYTDWTEKPAVQVIRDFLEDLEPDHPWIDAIKNLINGFVAITGAVITGVVDLVVGVADAIIDATVWAVKTIAEVTVNVVEGIVDLTSKVVHGIADAIVNSVNWVVEKVKSCLGIESSAPAQNRMMPATTALTVQDVALEEDEPSAPGNSTEPKAVEANVIEAEVTEPDVVDADVVEADVVEADVVDAEVTETAEVEVTEPEVTEPAAPAPPADDVTEETEGQEAEQEPAEEAETAPVTPRATTTTTARTAKTAKGPKTAASSGVK